jgi:hypothetical protein
MCGFCDDRSDVCLCTLTVYKYGLIVTNPSRHFYSQYNVTVTWRLYVPLKYMARVTSSPPTLNVHSSILRTRNCEMSVFQGCTGVHSLPCVLFLRCRSVTSLNAQKRRRGGLIMSSTKHLAVQRRKLVLIFPVAVDQVVFVDRSWTGL